ALVSGVGRQRSLPGRAPIATTRSRYRTFEGGTMSDDMAATRDLKAELTPQQYEVTQHGGTEQAFTGIYWDHHGDGVYACVVCRIELFDSGTKFESGSGWPSFWEPAE